MLHHGQFAPERRRTAGGRLVGRRTASGRTPDVDGRRTTRITTAVGSQSARRPTPDIVGTVGTRRTHTRTGAAACACHLDGASRTGHHHDHRGAAVLGSHHRWRQQNWVVESTAERTRPRLVRRVD